MQIRRRLAVGMAWMFAGNGSEQLANFLVFVVLVRILGPEAFGLAAMATVFVLLAELLVRESMTETLIQLPTVEEGHRDAVFWLLGAFSLSLVGLIALSADLIAAVFNEPRVTDYVIWATPTILFIGFSGVPVASLRRDLEFRILAIRATIGVLAGGVVGITMAVMGFGVWSLIAQRVVQVCINNLLAWIAFAWRPGFRATRQHVRDVVGFSSQMIAIRFAELVSLNAPTVIIGSYLGPVILGQYTVAWRVVEILSLILIAPIRYVAQPAFAHMSRGLQSAGTLLYDVMSASSLITIPSFLGMAAVGGTAMSLLFGEEWIPAVPALQVLCLVGVYLSVERLQQSFCVALGRARDLVYLSIAEATLGVGAMLAVVEYGLVAVAAAFAIGYYVVWPFRIRLVTGIAELSLASYLERFLLPLLGSVALYLAVLGWQSLASAHLSDLPLLASCLMIGFLVYAAFVAVTMRGRVRELLASLKSMRTGEDG